jgi:dTDP-3-amino-3,4,6-trideoxy-alpha-D-glucose transaminase
VSVPLFASSLERYEGAIAARMADVAASGHYILGPEVEAFERELAAYCGVRFSVGVGNGTDAITIALRAMGIGPGDEVVLPSFTYYATAEAAVNAGAEPVFCDVDPATFCVTAETVEPALGPRTRAILPVHLFGNPAPVDDLRALGPPVLEDAAQAIGARLGDRRTGALGTAGTFSFYPSKNLPCVGDGGAIVTDDEEVADRARRLRFHGSADKVTFTDVGYNSRLDELQAAVLRVLLPELDDWNQARRRAAAAYEERGLGEVPGVELPRPTEDADHVYHLYVIRHERADSLAARLAQAGVSTRGYYRRPVHLQPGMAAFGGERLELPGTEEAARTNIALPMGTELSEGDVERVVDACASGST